MRKTVPDNEKTRFQRGWAIKTIALFFVLWITLWGTVPPPSLIVFKYAQGNNQSSNAERSTLFQIEERKSKNIESLISYCAPRTDEDKKQLSLEIKTYEKSNKFKNKIVSFKFQRKKNI